MAFAFDPQRDVGKEARRIGREELDLCRSELLSREMDPDLVVHSVRKRLKRVRALMRLIRDELGIHFAEANHGVRDAGRRLSPLRDAHVVLAALDALRVSQGSLLTAEERSTLGVLESELATARDKSRGRGGYRRVRNATAKDLVPLRAAMGEWRFRHTGFDALGPGFGRSYGQGRRAMHRALETGEPTAFHRWRKRVKDHWHHCELLTPGWRASLQRRGDRIHLLSDGLGTIQDLEVLEEAALRITDAGAPKALGPLLQDLIGRERERLVAECGGMGIGLFKRLPRTLVGSVALHWPKGR